MKVTDIKPGGPFVTNKDKSLMKLFNSLNVHSNRFDVADNDASGWKNGWMDDFYHRMTRMIIAV